MSLANSAALSGLGDNIADGEGELETTIRGLDALLYAANCSP